jgi:iron complex outermembrane recepter protein
MKSACPQEVPFNSVKFGGYLLHEVYNAHNLFYNSAYGGSGAQQVVSAGSKFRSGYFQQDDVAFYAQDDVHPISQIHIIPGVRVVGFSTSYSDQAQRDFKFPPGVIYATHCSLFPQTDPYHDIFGTPTTGPDGAITTDTGSQCGAHESRSAVEPSIDASVMPYEWLTIYGGYDVTYRSPSLGGGGGMLQSVDPTYYTLAKGAYQRARRCCKLVICSLPLGAEGECT